LPDVPTVAEAGVPGYEATSWIGLLAPTATPPAVIAALADAVDQALREPSVREVLLRDGSDVVASKPEEFREVIEHDDAKYGRLSDLLQSAK
jgi:tripartite-type tricarboxylate transporter receptor subunit TctC